MRLITRKFFILLLIFITIFLSACQIDYRAPEHSRIGIVLSNLDNPFFQAMNTGAQDEANKQDVILKVLDSKDSSSIELSKVKSLVDSGIDLLILNPTDSDSVYQSVRYANQKNIPVITVDRISTGGQIVCHITSNNVNGGQLAAQFMIENCNNVGDYAILRGIEGTSASLNRGKGFQNYMNANSQMTQVSSLSASFDRNLGKNMMTKLLSVHPDLKAVFAENDEMALGAIEAIKNQNLDLLVIGFDGTPEALEAVKAGTLDATIAQQPEQLGSEAIRHGISYLQGNKIPETVQVDVKLVTK